MSRKHAGRTRTEQGAACKPRVRIGSRVKLLLSSRDDETHSITVEIGAPGTADLDREPVVISCASTLGQELQGRAEGEQFEIEAPAGMITYKIVGILTERG